MIPDESTTFGQRVRRRLTEEQVVWLTTVGDDGTPQPNPVWFLWQGDDVLIYNATRARRLAHLRSRPRVSLHFNSDAGGDDVIVLAGTAEIVPDHPSAADNPAYREKYGDGMVQVSGSVEAFAEQYSVPARIHITHVRGF
ncbi:MAG TPA: TIGR03667 family PPOX class F420-dependent oxidoreductase [Streptosporangiaceae bacterium]